MEVRFSRTLRAPLFATIQRAAGATQPAFTSSQGNRLRFTLPGATVADHDRVIRALLTLDPDATIRTARAVYEGLADFEAQFAARNK